MDSTHPIPDIDPAAQLPLAELERRFEALKPAPVGRGRVTLLMARGADHARTVYDRVLLTEDGMPGDRWGLREDRVSDDQLAVMGHRVAELIANGQSMTLFGDNIALDLDLSDDALPTGSRVQLGDAILEVTPKPHNGCKLYAGRFGAEALRFISQKPLRSLHLRGIYLRVVQPGEVWLGARAIVLD